MTDAKRMATRAGSPVLAAAISSALSMSGTASAQETASLGEVIVTATRRAESLQDVSESISAFDSDAIAMRGIQQLSDIVKFIPGMSLAQREPGGTTLVFRGVASSGTEFGGVSSSALYLDEQPITQGGRNPTPRFIDIERVEVLRGPQGTLYGASSQSGTLRVITNKPQAGAFDSWAEAQVSDTSSGSTGYDLSAMVNIPLGSDRVALRLVGFAAEDAGFIDNVLRDSQGGGFTNADRVDEDVNTVTTIGGRAALSFDVTENLNLSFGAIFQDLSADGHGDVSVDDPDGLDRGLGELEQVRFENESLDDEWYQVALTASAQLPFGDLIVSGSYFDRDFAYEADASDYEFSLNASGYVSYDFGGDPRGFATNNESTEITTFEARLQSNNDAESRWSWLAGVFYSKEEGHTEFNSYVRGYADTNSFSYFNYYEQELTGNSLVPSDQWWRGVYDTELEQKAVFGEIGFDVTEDFTITAGGRWFDYDRFFALLQENPPGFTGASRTDEAVETSESDSVYKLNLTYRINDDRMVYATWSEGFRVGGNNPVKPSSILPREFSSDTLTNMEIGAKTEWLDNRLRFNVAAFMMDWKDFAVQVEDPQTDNFQLGYVNLPSADITGIEAEFQFVINDAWQLDGTVGWIEAEIAEDTTIELDPGFDPLFASEGARLPLTPDWTATLGIEFRPRGQLLNAQPFARLDLAYVGESVTSLDGIQSVINAAEVGTQDSYSTGDLRFGLEGEQWSTTLFVDNVWDERAGLFLSPRWAAPRQTINRPRTIGLRFRYEF
ncbi:MAG: TonB-dependent receptor [Steroidobacteraceae bacterium]